jgi:hypothetical protein
MDRLAVRSRTLLQQRRASLEAPGAAGGAARAPTGDEQRELAEIDAALARIEDGTYGRCEVCGHAIGFQRLRAVPEARTCVNCSSRREPGP